MVTTELENGVRALELEAIQKCKRCKEIDALVIVRQESLCRFVPYSRRGTFHSLVKLRNSTKHRLSVHNFLKK